MSEISDDLRDTVIKRFEKELRNPVKLILFTQELECTFCKEVHSLIEAVANLSDKISLQIYDFQKDEDKAKDLGVDKIPALAILGEKDYGLRFFGIPSGYEFQTLIEAIILVSTGDSQLPPKAVSALSKAATKPVHIQIFVIPTCPVCPVLGAIAYQFAVANSNISVNIVEIAEFPHLANRYNVVGTPKTVINEKTQFEGLVPPAQFINFIQQAAQGSPTGISSTI